MRHPFRPLDRPYQTTGDRRPVVVPTDRQVALVARLQALQLAGADVAAAFAADGVSLDEVREARLAHQRCHIHV